MNTFFTPRRPAGRLALAIGLGALLAASAAGWAAKPPADETFGVEGPASRAQKTVRATPSEAMSVTLGTVPEVRLQAVDKDALLKEDALSQRQGLVKSLRFGVGRGVQVSAGDGNWYDVAGGARLWVADVASTDAIGLRLHFKNVKLPDGAQLVVYSPDGAAAGVARNGNLRFDPERNAEFHDALENDRTEFWTGSFLGERARIEYLAPAGAGAALPFTVDNLQHFYLDPVDKVARSLVGKAAGSCENDVTCYPEWKNVSHGVAGIDFVEDGGSFFCSGQLLNTNAGDFTPYFLTANHCISSQSGAASTEFFWFYQTSSCNGNPPSVGSLPRSDGASLVSTSPVSDYTLLLINGALPDNLYWVGWTGQAVPLGTDAVAVHHPSADYKRISFGFNDDTSECYDFQGTNGLQLVRTSWTDGVTEGGSSGSGIFRADTQQLYGQLFFGPSSCSASAADRFDCYGSFFSTYPKIKKSLLAGTDDNSEQNDTCAKGKAVRAGALNGRIVKVNDSDWYKISVPAHKTVTVTVTFKNGNGDIDLAGFGNCSSRNPVASSTGSTNTERISLQNVTNKATTAYWDVYLASSTRNTYNMSVTVH